MLICPNCKEKLKRINRTYECRNRHSFDISKEGYVNLLLPNMTSSSVAGDNQDMVKARYDFLRVGYYQPLLDVIVEKLELLNPNKISLLDCGCGEGYFTISIANKLNFEHIFGVDISKYAIAKAAKQNNKIEFIAASGVNLPFSNHSFDFIINILSPHFNDEFSRVLKRNGYLIKVIPNKNHLRELKEIIYDNPYYNESKALGLESFSLIENSSLEYVIKVINTDIENLFKMTPYYYKTSKVDKQKITNLPLALDITASFEILIYSNER